VLFLDEPTASLDPASTKGIEDVIGAIAASGIKIVMSTHDLGEARRLAGERPGLDCSRRMEKFCRIGAFDHPATMKQDNVALGDKASCDGGNDQQAARQHETPSSLSKQKIAGDERPGLDCSRRMEKFRRIGAFDHPAMMKQDNVAST
jgi:energy-coupling factor transporter ATP-binding protein EcfA2